MIWYTEKQLETAWKTYFKVCNENMITPLTIDDFRPIYEQICAHINNCQHISSAITDIDQLNLAGEIMIR